MTANLPKLVVPYIGWTYGRPTEWQMGKEKTKQARPIDTVP